MIVFCVLIVAFLCIMGYSLFEKSYKMLAFPRTDHKCKAMVYKNVCKYSVFK